MKRFMFIVCYGALWSGLIAGSLQISRLSIPDAHSLCGPWGCLPDPAALLSVHSMWASLIVPLAVLVVWASKLARIRLIWQIAFGTSMCMLVGFVGYDGWNYVFELGGSASDLPRRALFRIVTATDFPIVQLAFASGLNWFLCSFVFINGEKLAAAKPPRGELLDQPLAQ